MFKKNVAILNEQISYYTDYEELDKTKPIVLFIHGFNDSGIRVFSLFNKPNREYQLISLDLPGCGNSTANTSPITLEFYSQIVDEFINKIIGKRFFYICTHSLGTSVAMLLTKSKKYIKWMLLVTPAIYYNETNPNYLSRNIDFLLPKTAEQLLQNSLMLVAPDEEKSILKPSFANKILTTPQEVLKQRYNRFNYLVKNEIMDTNYLLKVIKPLWLQTKNVTVVFAQNDRIIPFHAIEEVIKENNIESVFVENAGHAIFFSNPNLMNNLITQMTKEK